MIMFTQKTEIQYNQRSAIQILKKFNITNKIFFISFYSQC